jgi:hypothetical protein
LSLISDITFKKARVKVLKIFRFMLSHSGRFLNVGQPLFADREAIRSKGNSRTRSKPTAQRATLHPCTLGPVPSSISGI